MVQGKPNVTIPHVLQIKGSHTMRRLIGPLMLLRNTGYGKNDSGRVGPTEHKRARALNDQLDARAVRPLRVTSCTVGIRFKKYGVWGWKWWWIEKKSSGCTTSKSDHSLHDCEAFCFEEKSSSSTTSHSDPSLLEYESFYFDLSIDPLPPAERSDSHHEEFTDGLTYIISPPEYDHFYFDLEEDPGELTRPLKENISETSTKDLTIHELNDFPLLLSDCDSTFSEEFSEMDLLVSFTFRNKVSQNIHYQRSPILEISYSSTGRFFYYLIRQ
ncbi:hypothetical protein Tco_0796374 [Tanacetum coccineum]